MTELYGRETVGSQYAHDGRLSARILLHDRYSTNKYGFYNWLFGIYEFEPSDRILELGRGNGAQ